MPVLSGHSRANSLAGAAGAKASPAAGAPVANQTAHRRAAEMNLERKQRAPARSIVDQYDAFLDASEEHTFSKLRANLQRMERKAEREHNMLNGAAGVSVEARNQRADARTDGRREKSPARFAARDASRMHYASGGNSVASLMQQPDARDPYKQGARPSSPRPGSAFRLPTGGDQSARSQGGGDSTDRCHWGGGAEYAANYRGRAASPRPARPASPRLSSSATHMPRPTSPRRATSPRQTHDAPRAQSPFRMRPEQAPS